MGINHTMEISNDFLIDRASLLPTLPLYPWALAILLVHNLPHTLLSRAAWRPEFHMRGFLIQHTMGFPYSTMQVSHTALWVSHTALCIQKPELYEEYSTVCSFDLPTQKTINCGNLMQLAWASPTDWPRPTDPPNRSYIPTNYTKFIIYIQNCTCHVIIVA